MSHRTRPLTQRERETRALAYMLKSEGCDETALQTAAAEMAAQVYGPVNLIPVPDHAGGTAANLRLARAIAAQVEGKAYVYDILTRTQPAPSACERHRTRGPRITIEEHHVTRRDVQPIPCRRTFLVDNVITRGTTLRACSQALGFGTGLVFADATYRPE